MEITSGIWIMLLQIAIDAIENNPNNKWWKNNKEVWDSWEALKQSFFDMAKDGKFTIWELYDCYQKGQEFNQWLQKYQPKPEPKQNPYREMKGILTLNPIPSAKEIWDMGFNTLLPYGFKYIGQKQFIKDFAKLGGKIISPYQMNIGLEEDSILAWFIIDEPDCLKKNPEDMIKKVEEIRKEIKQGIRFDKPIFNAICGASIGCGYGKVKGWIDFINSLDAVLPTIYPYRTSISVGWEIDEMRRCLYEEWKDIKVPIIPVIQAHSGGDKHKWGLRKPVAKKQVDFWREKKLGFIVYPWYDGIDGVQFNKGEWIKALKEE